MQKNEYKEKLRAWESERQRILFYHLTNPELSMKDLGEYFGKSKQRISQIITQAKEAVK